MSSGTSTGDGGSLGVFSHANSPLKKATSMYDIQSGGNPRNSFDMARNEIAEQRERSKSPVKRQSDLSHQMFGRLHSAEESRRTSAPAPAEGVKHRPGNFQGPYQGAPSKY